MFDEFNANWKATKSSDGKSWVIDCNDMTKSALSFTINGVEYSVPFEQLVTRVGDTCTLDIKGTYVAVSVKIRPTPCLSLLSYGGLWRRPERACILKKIRE